MLHSINKTEKKNSCHAFTLIELLIVIAVISLLLAVLFPTLRLAKSKAKQLKCQNNLKQIATGWHMYLDDYDGRFLQGINVNHYFGGWKGIGTSLIDRPLNSYLDLPLRLEGRSNAQVFFCPDDRGGILGRPPTQKAYDYFGNSYQTNTLLIGPDQIGVPGNEIGQLHEAINRKLKGLKRQQVSNPSRLLLVGDNNWVSQWDSFRPEGKSWHNKNLYFSMAFLDSHVEYLEISKGFYVTGTYCVQPFESLNSLALQVQTTP